MAIDEDVHGFEVPMKYPNLMHMAQSPANPMHPLNDLGLRHGPETFPVVADRIVQVTLLAVFHYDADNKFPIVVLNGFVQKQVFVLDHTRVVNLLENFRFHQRIVPLGYAAACYLFTHKRLIVTFSRNAQGCSLPALPKFVENREAIHRTEKVEASSMLRSRSIQRHTCRQMQRFHGSMAGSSVSMGVVSESLVGPHLLLQLLSCQFTYHIHHRLP
mmetsp:Transcript_14443/g.49337  ORF Transcript_14443/g.49337 Transcript_14443/m.49337 type:complete len:216 (+) Transcript_14443:1812-2459(+)